MLMIMPHAANETCLLMQVSWMNHIMKTLWPHMNQAIGKMILETVMPMVADLKKQVG